MILLLGAMSAAAMEPWEEGPQESSAVMERRLALLVNDYRRANGLPPAPVSRSLTMVARAHVRDLMINAPDRGPCNMHSWSDRGAWTPVCYTPDHARAQAMWRKPREITRGAYPGNGYEIAYRFSGGVTPEIAMDGWENSPAHDALLIESGPWRDADWRAMGVGVLGGYAVVWFGKEPDR